MSLQDLYKQEDICKIEEKFTLIKQNVPDADGKPQVYLGKYPLEPFRDGARGTYGGELICQGVLACWESVSDPEMSPHSMHSYFVKAGSIESPIRWEVQIINNGRNYANRLALGYQSHNNKLVYTIQVSFVKNNSYQTRLLLTNEAKLFLQKKPQAFFYKYKDQLQDLNYIEHTHEFIQNIIPREYLEPNYNIDLNLQGSQELGFFVRFNDHHHLAKNSLKTKITQLSYISDSLYLGTLVKALGLPIAGHHFDTLDFFRVSLDHSVYYHDIDFDPSNWLFLDYRFSRLNNDRVLCQCSVFTLEGKMVASIVQEGLVYFKQEYVDSIGEHLVKEEVVAKL